MSGLESVIAQRRLQSEEELLEFQRQFQQGQHAPSTKVVRAVRKTPAAAAVAAVPADVASNASAAAVASPATTSSTAAAAAATPAPAAPATAAASSAPQQDLASERKDRSLESSDQSLLFRTAQGVRERGHVAAPRVSFGAGSVAAKTTGFPATFKADLRASKTAPLPLNAPQTSAGTEAPVKKKSLFAQQRDRMLAQQQAASAAAAAASAATAPPAAAAPTSSAITPVVQREVVLLSTAAPESASSPAALAAALSARNASASTAASSSSSSSRPTPASSVLPESKGIHEENLLKLDEMSSAEIEEAQRELEKTLPPALVAMLRARRAGGGLHAAAAGGGAAATAVSGSALGGRPAFQPAPDASYPTPAQLNEYLLDESLLGAAESDSDDADASGDDEGIDEHGERVDSVSQRLRLDQALEAYAARLESQQSIAAQAEKLEWSAPIQPSGPIVFPDTVQGYDNDAVIWNSWRVDFEGRFIAPGSSSGSASASSSSAATPGTVSKTSGATVVLADEHEDASNALYHHGDEADRPGYTMRELLHLARSTVMAQRTLSLQVMARVLARIRAGEYEFPAPVRPTPRAMLSAMNAATVAESSNEIPPFSHLLFSHLLYLNLCTLLRLSLDDNRNPAGVLATLHCFSAMLYHRSINEGLLLDAQASFKGHQMARRFNQAPSLAGEINKPEAKKQKQSADEDDEEEDAAGLRPDEKTDNDGLCDNARDEEMCARDLVVGLAHMQLLERMRYILEVYALPAALYRASPPKDIKKHSAASSAPASDALAGLVLLSPCFQVLLAFAQHSPQAASRLFDTPRLKEVIVRIIEALASVVASGSASLHSAAGAAGSSSSLSIASIASTLHTALLLLGTLSQVHRDIAFFFLHPHGHRGGAIAATGAAGKAGAAGLFATIKKFIVLPNGVPGLEGAGSSELSEEEMSLLLPLSIQSLQLWRICLSYGLDIEAFMDHFPVILGILAKTTAVVKRAVAVGAASVGAAATAATVTSEKLAELWLRQLRATVAVVEGLTLLFTPMSSSASALAQKAESYSAPPADLSFEFSHIVHAVEAVLSNLAAIWFAAAPEAVSLRASMHETLASFLHLFASYYRVLPTQPSFESGLLRVQIEKHTNMCFESYRASPLLAAAEAMVDQADQQGVAAIVEAYRSACFASDAVAAAPTLEFTNLPLALPRSDTRALQQSLNVLFGLLRWQESLLTCTPLPSGSQQQKQDAAAAAESKALSQSLRRVLLSSRALRSKLTRHSFSDTAAASGCDESDGANRLSSRRFILSPLESEMVVTLFVMDRLDAAEAAVAAVAAGAPSVASSAFVPTSIQLFYACVLQSIPSLLRNGQQFLVSKLLADVLFNGPTLAQLARSGPCLREEVASSAPQIELGFSASHAALLRDLYASFCYFPEELLVSTLLHTGSLLTPTLTPPLALSSNPVANMDVSTGRQFGVEIKLRQPVPASAASSSSSATADQAAESAIAAWLLIPLKHCRFLSVQLAQSLGTTERTKMTRVLTLTRFLYLVDETLGLLTPAPRPAPRSPSSRALLHRPGAHPMSTLFLRAFIELFLLGSEVFADSAFEPLSARFLDRLLDSPAVRAEAQRMARAFIGQQGPSASTLSMGASIGEAALGAATFRTQGHEFVDLLSPEAERNAAAAASAASSPAAATPLVPFFDFQSVTCFVSTNRSSLCTALWGQSFYPLFKALLEHFVADSMGDLSFGRVVTLLLQMGYPQDYRLAILREAREMMASLDCGAAARSGEQSAAEGLPAGGRLPYLFPLESNSEILQLHVAALAGAPPTLTVHRNPALYEVALHHVSCWLFGWSHVSGAETMSAAERVRRVQERLPMSTSPEVIRDLMNYRFACEEPAAAAAGAKGQAEEEKHLDPLVCALSPVQHAEIAAVRAAAQKRGSLVRDPQREYGLLCPCCAKHNSASASYCSGCGFALCAEDEAALPSNVFLALINRDPAALASNEVLSRDDRCLIVVDKFATSADPRMHVDCVPLERITDLTELRAQHLPLLEHLYTAGLAALQREYDSRGLAWLAPGVCLNDVLTAGYNEPVSVKQLHLHLVVPPFRHEKIMGYPRWHSHSKILRDLRTHGRVIPYSEAGNEAEARGVYETAIANNRRAIEWVKAAEEKQAAAAAAKAGAGARVGAAGSK